VLLWSGNKETIPYLQRIGRGTRKKVNGMNVSLAIDFKDVGGLYTFEDHYLKRKKLMEDSGIKILADVHDFIKLVEDIENAKEE
jgi:superfamily II DNA or RNA helicase